MSFAPCKATSGRTCSTMHDSLMTARHAPVGLSSEIHLLHVWRSPQPCASPLQALFATTQRHNTPLARRTREVVRPKLTDAWHHTHCALTVRIEQQEGRVVPELEPTAMLVRFRADVVLMAAEQGDLRRAPHAV